MLGNVCPHLLAALAGGFRSTLRVAWGCFLSWLGFSSSPSSSDTSWDSNQARALSPGALLGVLPSPHLSALKPGARGNLFLLETCRLSRWY